MSPEEEERRVDLSELRNTIDSHVAREEAQLKESLDASDRLHRKLCQMEERMLSNHTKLQTSVKENHANTQEIRADISGMLVAWEGLQGAMTFFNALGKFTKWATGLGAFIAMMYFAITHLHSK